MKTFVRLLQVHLLTAIFVGLALLSLSLAGAAGQGPPASTQPDASNPYYKLLDDFNTGDSRPCYAGNGGWISSPCPIRENSYVEMTYSVLPPTSHAYLPLYLSGQDLSGWDAVWIVIRGENGGEEVSAEFTDCTETVFPKEKISDYLSGGITTDWRAAAIPLNEFSEISDWTCLGRISIVANSDLPSGTGTVYVDEIGLFASTVLIDDFHDQVFENRLGRDSGPWSDPPATVTTTFPNGVLKLSYNVPTVPITKVGSGYWTRLLSTNLVALKDYLSFDVRGQQGGEAMWAQFIDCGTNSYTHFVEIKTSDYLTTGIKTNSRPVTIPLAAFVDVQSTADEGVAWGCIGQLAFNAIGRSQAKNGPGTIYLDNVKLLPVSDVSERLPLWVDHFNDCDDWNALSWKWYSQTIGMAEFIAITDTVNRLGDYGCGYRLTFDVEVEQSAWAWTELKGLDVTDYFYLEFQIKGKNGGEFTNVYLRDRAGKEHPIGIVTTNDWQQVKLPLSEFAAHGVNLTDLSEVKFAYEEGIRQGEVYVDDIGFWPPYVTALPLILKNWTPPVSYLVVESINTGGATVEIRDPNNGDALLLTCAIEDNVTNYCGSFPAVGTYKFIVFPNNCGKSEKIFDDALPGVTITVEVSCG